MSPPRLRRVDGRLVTAAAAPLASRLAANLRHDTALDAAASVAEAAALTAQDAGAGARVPEACAAG